jgi:hypothetical protein
MLRVCIVVGAPADPEGWGFVLRAFAPVEVTLIGAVPPEWKKSRITRGATFAETARDVPGRLVVFSPEGAKLVKGVTPLIDLEHRDDDAFLFGPDHGTLTVENIGRSPDEVVFIRSPHADQLHAHVAAGIILRDRFLRSPWQP